LQARFGRTIRVKSCLGQKSASSLFAMTINGLVVKQSLHIGKRASRRRRYDISATHVHNVLRRNRAGISE